MATDTPVTWEVTGQFPDAGPNQAGQYVGGMTVVFRLPSGATGQVFVPSSEYTPERVTERIRALARTMAAVHGSTS